MSELESERVSECVWASEGGGEGESERVGASESERVRERERERERLSECHRDAGFLGP